MIGKVRLGARTFFLFLCVANVFCSQAFAGTLTGEIDKIQGSMEDEFVYTLTASGKAGDEPQFPQIPGLNVEQTGKASNFSLINGAMSREVEYRFTIVPEKPGTYTIPSISLKVDGQKIATLPITIKVTGEAAPQAGTQANKDADIFLERSLSKQSAYVGEPIISTVRLYHRVPLLQANAKPTDIPGVKRIPIEGEKTYQKALNGQQYRVIEMKEVLVPNDAGTKEIEPFAVTAIISAASQPTRRGGPESLFENMFNRGRQMKKNVRSNEVKLQVKPLPKEGRTSDFSGLVGEFSFGADLSAHEIKAGDTVTLTMNISGNSYTDGLKPPHVTIDPSIKVYADKPISQETINEAGVQSSRTIKFALVPEQPGEFTIPPLKLEIFNTAKGAYETLEVKLPPLKVTGAAVGAAASTTPKTSTRKDVKAVGEDLLPLHSLVDARAQTLSIRDYVLGLVGVLCGVAFFLGGWARQRLLATSSQRQKRRRKDKALTQLQRRIKAAAPSDEASVATLGLALKEYIGTKAECRGESLTPKEAVAVLASGGVGESIQKQTHEWFTRLERFEYGGQTPAPEQWQSLTLEAQQLAEGMQKEWRSSN